MADTTLVGFGKAVKAARLAAGWTLEALAAEALGNPDRKGYCSQVEKGKRNLSENTIRSFARALGLPEQVTDPLLTRALPADDQSEAEDVATERLLTELETLRGRLKLSEALAIALAYKYAEGSPTDIEGALKGLEAAFETAAEQKALDALPSNIDAAVDDILKAVADKNDAGELEEADALLMAEIETRAALIERERAAQERLLDRALKQAEMTGNAEAYAMRTLASFRLEAPSVADQYRRLHEEAHEKYKHGLRFGDSFSLPAAAALWAQCADIGATLQARAVAQNNRAAALQDQGKRTEGAQGAELLAQAVAAFDAALDVYTREDLRVNWAEAQNNKGAALQNQGIRTEGARGAELLADAVAAYDAALEVRTRQAHPVDWAMTQNNLGTALQDQGIRTEGARGAELLAEAVSAYDAALEVRTRQAHPVHWAGTQNNKGNALKHQGIRTEGARGAELLAQAIAAYDAALEVRTRQAQPVDWAMTQENLAIAKEAWADHDSTPEPRPLLEEALVHVDAALTVFDPEYMSYNHAKATRLRDRLRAKLDALP